MSYIQLKTGKTIYVSTYEYFFKLEEKDVDEFFQSCEADDLGTFIEDPFSSRIVRGTLEIEDIPDVPDDSIDIEGDIE